MTTKFLKFGKLLKKLRIENGLTLREACKKTGYDYSNWSKIERGKLSPPSDIKTLHKWAKTLNLKKGSKKYQEFIDYAQVAQGIIPGDIQSNRALLESLPVFFRTVRNKQPTKEEIDKLVEIIRNS